MRSGLWFFLLIFFSASAQDVSLQKLTEDLGHCADANCKAKAALRISEWYNEKDRIEKSQAWLDYAKAQHRRQPDAIMAACLYSLQSELFYYTGLYQFGIHEAEKEIEEGIARRDSAFVADGWFFKGINLIETGKIDLAEQAFWKAKHYFPKKSKSYPRTLISRAYLWNNLAQVKVKKSQSDSAFYYNRKAHLLAKENSTWRAQANAEQLFGELFLKAKRADSAKHYFNQSIATARQGQNYDVALLSTGLLMKAFPHSDEVSRLYRQGMEITRGHEVNNLYKMLFYALCLDVFNAKGQDAEVIRLQGKMLELNRKTNEMANHYVQNISEKYMTTENRLLQARINELDQQRKLTLLQLLAAVFGILILLFVVLFFRRKNKLQQLLLQQKNEISKDLHDDIGSELSSIMINTNLLRLADTEKRIALLDKINRTTTEISQRVNAFIWSLDNENDTVGNFAEYVKHYSEKFLEGAEVSITVTENLTSVSHKILNGYFRKNLFFCVKEALNNAIRHSGATAVHVMIQGNEKSGLHLTIGDNGKGAAEESLFGNGFNNIRKRVAALKGTVRFVNQDGLAVIIRVPFPSKQKL